MAALSGLQSLLNDLIRIYNSGNNGTSQELGRTASLRSQVVMLKHSAPIRRVKISSGQIVQFGRKFRELVYDKAKRVKSQARRDLALPHEADRHAMIISSGLVALYLDGGSSQRRLVALRYPGEVIQPHESGLRLHALLDTEVLLTETDAFWDLVGSDLELCQLASQASERAQLVAYEWLMRDAMDAASATAHFLCEHAVRSTRELAEVVRLELTQLQIGDITAQTPVNVNRVMRGFQKDELFVPIGNRQFRANWPELRRLGRFDPAYLGRETVVGGT